MAEGFTLADLEKDVVVPDVEPTITTLGPTTEPTSEVPELTPEVPVSEQPVIEVPTEEEPVSNGFTLGDLYAEPAAPTPQVTTQQTQDLTSPFTLKDLNTPFSFNLEAEDRFVNVYNIFEKYDNKPLTKEDIVADPDLMEVVYQSLEARFPEAGFFKKLSKTTAGLQGAATGGSALMNRNYRAMEPEKAFEIYQNYQRSFDAAQSVTVANEIAYALGVDDETKNRLAGGYLLFNQMDNIFTGEGSWGEMFDGMTDYLSNACLLYTSPSPRDRQKSRMPSSA